jgi:hypothetical protein
MSSRSRMMGAGNAGSSSYNSNINLNTFGGSKKQGITSRVGLDNWNNRVIQIKSNGIGRNMFFCMNQLGGVGPGHSMFNGRYTRADAPHCNLDSGNNPLLFLINSNIPGDLISFEQFRNLFNTYTKTKGFTFDYKQNIIKIFQKIIQQYGIGNYISKKKISYIVGSYPFNINCQCAMEDIPCSCIFDNGNISCPVINECCQGCFEKL